MTPGEADHADAPDPGEPQGAQRRWWPRRSRLRRLSLRRSRLRRLPLRWMPLWWVPGAVRAALFGSRLRWLLTTLALLLIAAAVGIEGYVRSVPLPSDPRVPQASVLYYRDGRTVLARVGVENRTDVPLARVPEGVRRAVVAAEDRGFYRHSGLSARGIARAAWVNVTDGRGEGASTITQQYARNAYLTQRRTASRKAKEAALSVKIERRYSKDEILQRYLNTIYLGRGAYGIEAAAHAFFGTTVDRLTVAQGAVLAAQAKDPWGFDPAVNPTAARDRWAWVLRSMVEAGWLPAAEAATARYPEVAPRSPTKQAVSGPLGLVVDQVEAELDRVGVSPQALRADGLRVVTTIDQTAQAAAVAAIDDALRGQPAELRAALVAVEPETGAVRAYYGGNQGSGFFDDAAAPRPPASTFKPVVLAEGLRQGISYSSRWDGSSPRLFPGRLGVPLANRDGLQCPDCPLDEAMVQSLNTPFYALVERVGPSAVRSLALALGVPDSYDRQPALVDLPGDPRPGRTRGEIALGRYPVAPADLASVYATFAAGGVRTRRHVVQSVTEPSGYEMISAVPQRTRVLPAAVAADVTHVLSKVVAADGPVPGRPAAGKTGTQQYGDTEDNQDAWTAGYTPQLAAVTWIGRAQPGPIREAGGTPVEGAGLPYRIWRAFLAAALVSQPQVRLPAAAHVGSVDAGDAEAAARAPARGNQRPTVPASPPSVPRSSGTPAPSATGRPVKPDPHADEDPSSADPTQPGSPSGRPGSPGTPTKPG